MSVLFRRRYNVAHGRDGHHLQVRDEWRLGVVAETVTRAVLAALGHPCCGRGPLGRVGILDGAWWQVEQLPCRLARFDRPVVSLPLTVAQAARLRPDLVDDPIMFPLDGLDVYGYTWRDGVMVGTPEAEVGG